MTLPPDPTPGQPQEPVPVRIVRGPVAKGAGFTIFVVAMAFCVLPAVACGLIGAWNAITGH